ncbi:MAG: formyltransferase [Synergistaceae bacterium]|jgi:methionyl-tRNA formyltransferase|nr:formyltransferase [Synergistaceae bacterium]
MGKKMKKKRAVVFAYSSIGYECLAELLTEGIEVAAVLTHEDDPDEEKWFRSVRELAEENGIPAHTPEKLGEDELRLLRELRPDLIFSFSYRTVIPASILELAPLGAFNIHGALLPRYRGRACINWVVLNGETETGVTLHHMTARVDEGRIVDQQVVPIDDDDTAHDVFKKMIPAARAVLRRSLPAILEGAARGREQDRSQATYFGRRRPEDGLIDWSKSAREIHNLVRAVTHPFPGAFTHLDGKKLFVWRTRPHPPHPAPYLAPHLEEECITPGVVVSSSPLKVSTGAGALEIERAQWSDGEESKGDELRLPVGVVLTEKGHKWNELRSND